MSDDVFRFARKKITPEEIQPEHDPLERVQQMQERIAEETGRDIPAGFDAANSPFQIKGRVPEAFQQAMAQPESIGQPEAVNRPKPRRATPDRAASVEPQGGPSDELAILLQTLAEKHYLWEDIELPSKGRFYTNIPAVLHVRPMTGEEEQILATSRYVKKGKAIDMIFKSCIREAINPAELLSVDRTYLLIYLRGISYTPEYDVEVKCPECGMKAPTTIDLSILEVESCPDDFTSDSLNGVLPTTGFKFRYHLATGKDEQEISRHREVMVQEFGDRNEDDTLLFRTALLLESIEGVTEQKELSMLLKKLPINDVSHLRNIISDPPFGVETEVGIQCPGCAATYEIDLPMEANFFFPRKRNTPNRTRA